MPVQALIIAIALLSPGPAWSRPAQINILGLPFYSMGFIEHLAQLVALLVLVIACRRYKTLSGWPFLRATGLLTLKAVLAWELVCNADNLITSVRAAGLCKLNGGLHVYRTVEAEGFLGSASIEYWSKRGFNYVEKKRPNGDGKGPYFVATLENGESVFRIAQTANSRYELTLTTGAPTGYRIRRQGSAVRDRATEKILGELISYQIGPGWFDSLILSVLPGSWSPWTCGDEHPGDEMVHGKPRQFYGPSDVVKAVIKPIRQGVVKDETQRHI